MKKLLALCFLCACAYVSPPRDQWNSILNGTSGEAMTANLRVAKKPLYQAAGGQLVYKDNTRAYMDELNDKLENTLRKPGIQFSRSGPDIIIVIVRSAIIYTDSPEISQNGDDLLGDLANILNMYDRTWIEITGFSDATKNQENAIAFSQDMAKRVAVYLAKHNVRPIRMFATGKGSANPISDQSDIGRLMNRRIEIRLSSVI